MSAAMLSEVAHAGEHSWPTTGRTCEHCGGCGFEVDHKQLGADLRRFREWHQATLTAVATEMGLSKSYICDLELGRREWRKALIDRYRAAVMEWAAA